MMASNGRPAMMSNPMCAMASNGQMVMANQVQIGNPAQLQGKTNQPIINETNHVTTICAYGHPGRTQAVGSLVW